jgi:hypothetical protein
LVARHEPWRKEGLRMIAISESAPNLPYVTVGTADDRSVARLREGLARVMADPRLAAAREALLIEGIDLLSLGAYDRVLDMERRAVELGYGALT